MPDAPPPRPLTAPGVVAGLLADVAERDERLAAMTLARDTLLADAVELDERLAVQHEAMTQLRADHSEALAAMTARLDRALAANQRWAETLADVQQRHADVKRERDDARSAFAKLAGLFTQGAQSGWTARISGTVLRRLCVAAMCEPPSGTGLEALAEANALVAERDELRNALILARTAAREMADEFATWTVTPEDQERIADWRTRAGLDAP